MRRQQVPTPPIPDLSSCSVSIHPPASDQRAQLTVPQPECMDATKTLLSASPVFFGNSIVDEPTLVMATAVSTLLSTAGALETKQSSDSRTLSSPPGGQSNTPQGPPAAPKTIASPSTAKSIDLSLLFSLEPLPHCVLPTTTLDAGLGPSTPTHTLIMEPPILTKSISGEVSPSQFSCSVAAAISASASSPDSSVSPSTSISMTALTATVNAETVYATPVTLQFSVSTAPLQSPSPSPSTTAAPTFVTIPAPHTTTLSPAAKSGIAISVSVAAIILISALALLWRKRRSAETKRRNDLEAKAIWITRSFVVETEARSTGGESTDGLRNGGVIPAKPGNCAKREGDGGEAMVVRLRD